MGEWIAAIVFAGGGAIVACGPVRRIFAAYLAFVVLAFAFQSQLGENAARLRYMAIPLSLLAVRRRPLWVAAPLVALCISYNLSPLAWNYVKGAERACEPPLILDARARIPPARTTTRTSASTHLTP